MISVLHWTSLLPRRRISCFLVNLNRMIGLWWTPHCLPTRGTACAAHCAPLRRACLRTLPPPALHLHCHSPRLCLPPHTCTTLPAWRGAGAHWDISLSHPGRRMILIRVILCTHYLRNNRTRACATPFTPAPPRATTARARLRCVATAGAYFPADPHYAYPYTHTRCLDEPSGRSGWVNV